MLFLKLKNIRNKKITFTKIINILIKNNYIIKNLTKKINNNISSSLSR